MFATDRRHVTCLNKVVALSLSWVFFKPEDAVMVLGEVPEDHA